MLTTAREEVPWLVYKLVDLLLNKWVNLPGQADCGEVSVFWSGCADFLPGNSSVSFKLPGSFQILSKIHPDWDFGGASVFPQRQVDCYMGNWENALRFSILYHVLLPCPAPPLSLTFLQSQGLNTGAVCALGCRVTFLSLALSFFYVRCTLWLDVLICRLEAVQLWKMELDLCLISKGHVCCGLQFEQLHFKTISYLIVVQHLTIIYVRRPICNEIQKSPFVYSWVRACDAIWPPHVCLLILCPWGSERWCQK